MGRGRRFLWGCGAVLPVIALVSALGIIGSGVSAGDGEPFTMLVVLLVAALGLIALLLRHLPRVLAEQGVSVDAAGVSLVQRPRWWFRGRTLVLAWHEITGVTAGAVGDQAAAGTSNPSVSFHLRHAPPKDMTPTWAVHVDPGAAHTRPATAVDHPRIVVVPDADQQKVLVGAVAGHRPDLLGPEPPTAPAGPPGAPAVSTAVPGGYAVPAGPPPVGAEGTVHMRGRRIAQWITCLVPVAGALGVLVTASVQLGPLVLADGTSSSDLVPFVPFLVPLLAVVVGLPLLLAYLPQYWARQGATVDRFGIGVVTEPLWWSRGHRAHVPWADVHHIAVGHRGSGRHRRPLVEVHLHHIDHELRLPRWAALVLSGETTWGVSPARPALLFDLRGTTAADELVSLLRAARGDLFEDARPERDRPRGAPGGARPGRPPHGSSAPYWRSLRARRGWYWALGFGICLYVLVATAAMGLIGLDRVLERRTYGSLFPPLFWLVVMGALLVWSVRAAPRCLTHQGVSLDASGITLVQDPLLWFEGRTVFLPWDLVHLVRPGPLPGRESVSAVKVYMREPHLLTHVPTWCRLSAAEVRDAPAAPHRPLTLVTVVPGSAPQRDLAQALARIRPDLLPSL
jgi:hypothetical protein